MRTILFAFNQKEAKHRQIYTEIRKRIEDGQLIENSRLPSIRQLAETLNVSRNTTLQAYEQLAAEGYIRSEPKKGYYVQKFEPFFIKNASQDSITQSENKKEGLIDFRTGIVDQSAFPLKEWRRCANKVLNEDMIYGYCDPFGDKNLRTQLAGYLMQSRGLNTNVESIVIGSSTQLLLLQLSILLKEDYGELAIEEPGYDGARKMFELQGFHIEPVQVNEKGISVKALSNANARLLYVTPSHQFPTGTTIPIPERQQLVKWAKKRTGYIIEDDYDSEFRYKHQPVPALSSLDPDGNVIYVSTFSKAFLPAIRISYMVLPPSLTERYKEKMMLLEQSASTFHQRTMALFMEKGYWDSHLRRMRTRYKTKISVLTETIHDAFGEHVNVIGNHSGLYILVQVRTDLSEEMLIQKAKDCGVKVYSTKSYFAGRYPNNPMLQLGFANLTEDQIREGVSRLAIAWFPH